MTRDEAAALLYREALHLDRREWDEWLALYAEDAVFWIPAWKSETEQTCDPDREMSLVYYHGRRNLEDRVIRIRSGQSPASTPLPRTVHAVTNVLVTASATDAVETSASWTVHRYDTRRKDAHVFFGLYEHRLERRDGEWLIARKKVLLMNDIVPTVLDVYAF